MFRTLMICAIVAFAPMSLAAPAPAPSPATALAAGETVTMEVKGLVCDFCARSLEKVFLKKAKAQTVKVDLDHGLVTVVMARAGALSDAQAKKLITDSGFNLVKITRVSAPT
jgi:copper chaperone CopZ